MYMYRYAHVKYDQYHHLNNIMSLYEKLVLYMSTFFLHHLSCQLITIYFFWIFKPDKPSILFSMHHLYLPELKHLVILMKFPQTPDMWSLQQIQIPQADIRSWKTCDMNAISYVKGMFNRWKKMIIFILNSRNILTLRMPQQMSVINSK